MEHILNYLKKHTEMCLCYVNSRFNPDNGSLCIVNKNGGIPIVRGKDIEELVNNLLEYLYQK